MSPAQRILMGHALGVLSTLAAVAIRPHVHEQPLGLRLLVGLGLVALSGIGLRYLVGSDGETGRGGSGPNHPRDAGQA